LIYSLKKWYEIIISGIPTYCDKENFMENPVDNYWQMRLTALTIALEKNNFEVFLAKSSADAVQIVLEEILPNLKPVTASWGGSKTFIDTGLYENFKNRSDLSILDIFDKSMTPEEKFKCRQESLAADLFITGTNAVTETGQLVNLDMVGNRIAGITFGPKNVIILVGRNKIVADLDDAMFRIKNYSAPANAMRLDMKTPCAATGVCQECSSPDRICNTWTITEKSFPPKRVKVVLINEDMGL
jgi:hypothetical protein